MFSRILLALDGTESSDVAVSFATALARQSDSTVRVVHVNELLVGGRGYASETERESMEIVDQAVGYLRREGVDADGVHHLANCFTIADRIAEAAHDWGADVIVFGSKRRRWLPRFGGAGTSRTGHRDHRPARAGRTGALEGGTRNPSRELESVPPPPRLARASIA